MKPANPKLSMGRHALMLAAAISVFAAVDRAEAACDPPASAGITNTTVTCTGTTTNQNGTAGYGVETDKSNTINVESGASVTGTSVGIQLTDSQLPTDIETINNFGAISGAEGISGRGGIVNNNTGATIFGTGGSVSLSLLMAS